MRLKGLYVNHKKQKCGVYEFGKDCGDLICSSTKFEFLYCECDSLEELTTIYRRLRPDIIIYNYHPATMPWVKIKGKFSVPLSHRFQAIQIGTIHEVYQELADNADNKIFDFHLAADPTLLLKNPLVYKTGRLLPFKPVFVKDINGLPVIGSFGFATPGKGFEKIVDLVQNEFEEAIIKFNIPFAKFGDTDGKLALNLAQRCRTRIRKQSIRLEINHDYLERGELITFLSSNTVNIFLYDDMENRGISSATDWALASGRPVAVSKSRLFRHLLQSKPSICVEETSLKSIIRDDGMSVRRLYEEYSPEMILWEYETMLEDILSKMDLRMSKTRTPFRYFLGKINFKIRSRLGMPVKRKATKLNKWTKVTDKFVLKQSKKIDAVFSPISLPEIQFNRILDNRARLLYKFATDFLGNQLPELIAKKIPEANIQQAFVLDTTVRLAQRFSSPKILAVGSFEDTAVEALKLLDYSIDDIDPILNYDLSTYLKRPHVEGSAYDLIISTSVIEHVLDDEQFLKDIEYLLKKGGYAILTCDYNDQYKPGDDIPAVDFRFYTQTDIRDRLLKATPSFRLIDTPQWDCEEPDFVLTDKYRYTFATIVLEKIV